MTNRLACALILLGGALCASSSRGDAEETPPPATPVLTQAAPLASKERSIFVSVPPQFADLKRAPVLFPHDRHTRALKEEGCSACHPRKDGAFAFSFPIERKDDSRSGFMKSFHDACIDCHTARAGTGRKAGPVTCGECHSAKAAYHEKEYLPALPQDYGGLRDTYHKECAACHLKSPGHSKKGAGDLDWKSFYVRAQQRIAVATPKVVYDYYIHDKHQKPLEKKCELCHYLPPELKQKLAAEGKEPTGQDWLRQEEPGKSLKQKDPAHLRCLNCHLQRRE